ncbi:MAG: hypothetical protein NW224_23625, partial [Leptolyngbyaceae cyanobacterium bins.302]|nr:hypothetical protein [Leptolyngbyaceae cyanobacterium bins.302]
SWKPLADYITSGSLIVNLRCKRKQLNQPILRGSYSFSSTFLFPIKSKIKMSTIANKAVMGDTPKISFGSSFDNDLIP